MQISQFTIRDYIRIAVTGLNNSIYCGHGNDHIYDEAVNLVLGSLNLPLNQLEPYFDAKLFQHEKDVLDININKRLKHIPVAYIIKKAIIADYEFYIDERAIIPRSFIPQLICDGSLDAFVGSKSSVLDLCTGNGSIAIIAADYYSGDIVASDISSDALEIAKINIKKYKFEDRINLIQSDIFHEIPNKFDVIFTNPPYIKSKNIASLPDEYLFEPKIALDGGADGLEIVKNIIMNAGRYLKKSGILVLEIGDDEQLLESLYKDIEFIWLVQDVGHVALIKAKHL